MSDLRIVEPSRVWLLEPMPLTFAIAVVAISAAAVMPAFMTDDRPCLGQVGRSSNAVLATPFAATFGHDMNAESHVMPQKSRDKTAALWTDIDLRRWLNLTHEWE